MSKPAAPAPEAPAVEAAPSKKLTIIKIGGVIGAIMVLELVVMLVLMPGGSKSEVADDEVAEEHTAEVEEHGGGHGHGAKEESGGHGHGHGGGHGSHGSAPAAPPKSANATTEIDLGEFSVTSYQPAASTTLFISFHLFGTLQYKNMPDLERRLDDNKHRIRDNIIVIIRSAEITDLTDAGLGLIKRRILETTNKTLGKPLLQAVVFSEFSFVEQ